MLWARPRLTPRCRPAASAPQVDDPSRWHVSSGPCPIKTTLLVMPANLLRQWQHEIRKHTETGALKVRSLSWPCSVVPVVLMAVWRAPERQASAQTARTACACLALSCPARLTRARPPTHPPAPPARLPASPPPPGVPVRRRPVRQPQAGARGGAAQGGQADAGTHRVQGHGRRRGARPPATTTSPSTAQRCSPAGAPHAPRPAPGALLPAPCAWPRPARRPCALPCALAPGRRRWRCTAATCA